MLQVYFVSFLFVKVNLAVNIHWLDSGTVHSVEQEREKISKG